MTDFDKLLSQIHDSGSALEDSEGNDGYVIKINNKREFEIPDSFNKIIAYAGDVNSQIITFQIPKTHEGHDLEKCAYKCLRWKNLTSGIEDLSTLKPFKEENDSQFLQWIVPPAAFTQSGKLEISITLCDLVGNRVAFSWNTPTFSGFEVGSTQAEVGGYAAGSIPSPNGIPYPAKDEILFIDEENRSIVAPKGYNGVVANYGDKHTSYVYFQTTRYLRGIDLLEKDVTISIATLLQDKKGVYEINTEDILTSFADGSHGEGLVDFVWKIPTDITNNAYGYVGPFSIAITFVKGDFKWTTSKFSKLSIGDTLNNEENEIFQKDTSFVIDGSEESDNLSPLKVSGKILFNKKTENEWNQIDSEDSPYIPLKGEKVVYDIDTNYGYTRVKFGDGETRLKDLPFQGDPTLPDWTREKEPPVTSQIEILEEDLASVLIYEDWSDKYPEYNWKDEAKNYITNEIAKLGKFQYKYVDTSVNLPENPSDSEKQIYLVLSTETFWAYSDKEEKWIDTEIPLSGEGKSGVFVGSVEEDSQIPEGYNVHIIPEEEATYALPNPHSLTFTFTGDFNEEEKKYNGVSPITIRIPSQEDIKRLAREAFTNVSEVAM